MSKSIDTILKELIESQSKQTVALNEKLTAMAGDNNTYFERMKKMEDGLTEAMKKVLEMDASMKECNKDMAKKVEEMEAKYAGMYKAPEPMTEDKEDGTKVEVEVSKEDSKEDSEDESDMKEKVGGFKETGGRYQGPMDAKAEYEDASTTGPRQMDQNAKAEDMPVPAEGGNVLEGINKEKVTGQPDDEEDAPKMKRVRGGNKSKAEELNEQPKAEEIKEVKAGQEKPATVASEESSINATAKALGSKIEAVLEKLASVNQSKPMASAEVEATKVALANETKAKEEAIAHMKALNEKFEALVAKVSTIEKSASTVEQKAAQIVAQTGVEAVAVSVDQQAKAEQTDDEVFKQFETLKGAEQRKFYLANKAIIERHASSLLRAKRS